MKHVLPSIEVSPYWMRVSTGTIMEQAALTMVFSAGHVPIGKYRLRVIDGRADDVYIERILVGMTRMNIAGPLSSFEDIEWEIPMGMNLTFEGYAKRHIENLVVQLEDAS